MVFHVILFQAVRLYDNLGNMNNNYGQPIYNHQASPQTIPPLLGVQLPQHHVPVSAQFQQAYINNQLVPNQTQIIPNAIPQIAPSAVPQIAPNAISQIPSYPNPIQLLRTTIAQHGFLQPSFVQQQPLYGPYPMMQMPLNIGQQPLIQNNYNTTSPQLLASNPISSQLQPTVPITTVSVTNTLPVVQSSSSTFNSLLGKIEKKKKSQVLPRPPDEPMSTNIPPPPLPESEDDSIKDPSSALKIIVGGDSVTNPSTNDKQNYKISSPESDLSTSTNKVSVSKDEISQEETVDTLYEISLTTNKTDEDPTENKPYSVISDRKRKQKPVELYGQHHKRRRSLGSVPLSSQVNSTSTIDEARNDDTTKKKRKSKKKR